MADIETEIRDAFKNGAGEIVVRVSRYGKDGKTPEAYQAIVRNRVRQEPWQVGILADPVSALRRAFDAKPSTPVKPTPAEDAFG